jgi:hypothetical protein
MILMYFKLFNYIKFLILFEEFIKNYSTLVFFISNIYNKIIN